MTKNHVTILLFVVLLILAFWGGWKTYPKLRPCPEIRRDTIKIYDTTPHSIPDVPPFYDDKVDSVKYRDPQWMDSVIKANKVDTMAILYDYYALHYFTRDWYDINQSSDTLIHIRLEDFISQNMPLDNNFSYRYYLPTQIINNSVTTVNYQSFLYGTLNFPVNDMKYASVGLSYASGRGLIGVGYIPYYKGMVVTGGFKLIRFRQR